MSNADKIADLLIEIAELHNDGNRCRYDPECIAQQPLPDGMPLIEKEMCLQCGYEDRHKDEFCKKYLNVWGILSKIDPDRYGPGGTES